MYDVSGGDCPGPTSGLVFGDIAIQPQTNLLYGVTATPSGEVFKVDLSTLKLVGQGTSDWQLILAPGTDKGVQIAFDASYITLYGVTAGNAPGGGVWYTIDLNTGVEKATGEGMELVAGPCQEQQWWRVSRNTTCRWAAAFGCSLCCLYCKAICTALTLLLLA